MWSILIYIWCLNCFLNERQVSDALKLVALATVLNEREIVSLT